MSHRLEYPCKSTATDGIFAGLLSDLSRVLDFDGLSFDEQRTANASVLVFRNGSRRVLRIKLARRSDRYVVEIGGDDQRLIPHCVAVCREYFDGWFRGPPAMPRKS